MSILKNALTDNVVTPATRANMGIKTVAKVIAADESSNRCSVRYLNKDSRAVINTDVMVDLRNGQSWFPKINDLVIYDMSGSAGMVVSMYTEDYAGQVRGKKKLDNDKLADGQVSIVGGSII